MKMRLADAYLGAGAPRVITANGYGLVVMTLASHARGRGFDPLFPYAFLLFVSAVMQSFALIRNLKS